MKHNGIIKEFKEFISRGNVMDMAVGVIIGGAFSGIVNSLTTDIISPIIGIAGGTNFDTLSVQIFGGVTLYYGKFLTAVVNFLLISLIIFLMMKAMNTLQEKAAKLTKQQKETPVPTTKICPYCQMEIPIAAKRCGHCTSLLDELDAE